MKWVLASNYMVDMTWLLSACPHLLQAQQLVIVHGERTPDRYGTFTLTCYNTCSLTSCSTSSTICMQREVELTGSTTGAAKTMAPALAAEMRLTYRTGLSVRIFGSFCGHLEVCQQPPSCSIQHISSVICQLMLKSTPVINHACGNVCAYPCSCRGGVACLTHMSTLNCQHVLTDLSLPCELNLHAMAQCLSTVPLLRQQHE